MTRPRTINLMTIAFLLGGLSFLGSCQKKNEDPVVPVFPDRPEVRFEESTASSTNRSTSGNRTGTGNRSSNRHSDFNNNSDSVLDETGSIPETHTIPAEAASAETIPELPNIEFGLNSHELTGPMKSILQKHIDYLQKQTQLMVVLRGHTDEQGTDEYNYSLGQWRATAVRDFLLSSDIDGNRLSTLSYGEDYPLVEGENSESFARNRRVEFLIYETEN